MNNPTLVVVTDRMDLNSQLFQTFSAAKDLLKQSPQQRNMVTVYWNPCANTITAL
jgi:type I restriction enzyme R subunit